MPERVELQIKTLCRHDEERKEGGSEDGMDTDSVPVKYTGEDMAINRLELSQCRRPG